MLDEGIVLLCSPFCQWLEPLGVGCYAILVSLLLEALGYGVGDVTVDACSVVDDIYQFLIDICSEILVHLLSVEYLLSEEFTWSIARSGYLNRLSLGSL